jgi:DNA (cytosine-5)-methyltransferase 1
MSELTTSLQKFSHITRKVGPQVQKRINALKIGQKMQDLPEELWHDSFRYYVKEDPTRNGGPNLRIIRLDPRKPSLTVTGYIFNKFVHPFENRYITPREAARLQGFPDDILFYGTLTSVQRQVGNAVPVQMAQAITRQILEHADQYHPLGLGKKNYKNMCFPAVSLFSGAGGMDLGVIRATHKKSMFDVRVCVELDHDCCQTLRQNFGLRVDVCEEDMAQLDRKEIMSKCNLEEGLLPLVVGGPPCQSFSQAGKQQGIHDPRGELIFKFLHFIRVTKPVYFVMENVSNLRGVSRGALLTEIQTEIDKMGYNFTCNLLCAADYGAPQLRRRLVFIGVKKPFPAVQAPLPTHGDVTDNLLIRHPYVGVGTAFEGLPSLRSGAYDTQVEVKMMVSEALARRDRYRSTKKELSWIKSKKTSARK